MNNCDDNVITVKYVCCAFCADVDTCAHRCDGLTGDDGLPCDAEMQALGCDELTDDDDCFKAREEA